MKKTLFLTLVVLSLLGLLATDSIAGRRGGAGIMPNIVFIMIDDVGQEGIPIFDSPYNWQLAGAVAAGSIPTPEIPLPFVPNTPHLNTLAGNGINFASIWVGGSCSATRHSLATGIATTGFGYVDGLGNETSWSSRDLTGAPLRATDAVNADPSLQIGYQMRDSGYFLAGDLKCFWGFGNSALGRMKHANLAGVGDSCGWVGSTDTENPISARDWYEWDAQNGVQITHTYEHTDHSDTGAWFPNGASSPRGYLARSSLQAETLLDMLDTLVFTPNPGINHKPFAVALSLSGGHSGGHSNETGKWFEEDSTMISQATQEQTANPDSVTILSDPLGHTDQTLSACKGYTLAQHNTLGTGPERTKMEHMCMQKQIEVWDDAVGRVVAGLGPEKLLNTYIIFMGDNPTDRNEGPWEYQVPSFFGTVSPQDIVGNLSGEAYVFSNNCTFPIDPASAFSDGTTNQKANLACGKGGMHESMISAAAGLLIGYGPIPQHSRGQTSQASLMIEDLHEGISQLTSPGAGTQRAFDGYDMSSIWGKGCTDWSDWTSDCHSLRGWTAAYNGSADPAATETECWPNMIREDPTAAGEVFYLVRSRCFSDYVVNLRAANPWLDLRGDAAYSSDYARLLAAQIIGGGVGSGLGYSLEWGQDTEGPCNYNGTCPP